MCGPEQRGMEMTKIRERELCNYYSSASRASASKIEQRGEDAASLTCVLCEVRTDCKY